MASTLGSLTTALAGANNDMVFTARFPGPSSANLKIKYTDPGTETATESVAVTYDPDTHITLINVTLRSVSAVLSTAAQVKTAIEANLDAAALVTIAASGGDTLATAVTALAATALSAGVADATTGYGSADECEDDGWKLGSYTHPADGAIYTAELLVHGQPIRQEANTQNGAYLAAYRFKRGYLAKASPLELQGAGTVD
jgi:hypothetical protein